MEHLKDEDSLEFPLTDAADSDWRKKFKLQAAQTAATRLRDLPRDVRQRVRGPFLKAFDAALRDAYERGDYQLAEGALFVFDQGLLKAAVIEFEAMRKAAGNGVSEFIGILSECGWNGIETDTIARLLDESGERIARVDFRWIETSKNRRIGRSEIQGAAMPSTQTNGRWSENFISEANLSELEAEAERKRNALPPWADNYNRDLPRGVRA